jgi:hypothetical protein
MSNWFSKAASQMMVEYEIETLHRHPDGSITVVVRNKADPTKRYVHSGKPLYLKRICMQRYGRSVANSIY